MKRVFAVLWIALLFVGTAFAEPRCNPPGLQKMADEKQKAIAVSVWKRLADDQDRHSGTHAERDRLDREVGGVEECEKWAHAHGKPDDTPGRGPR